MCMCMESVSTSISSNDETIVVNMRQRPIYINNLASDVVLVERVNFNQNDYRQQERVLSYYSLQSDYLKKPSAPPIN